MMDPAHTSASRELRGWVPFRIRVSHRPPIVEWCHLGEERFTAPFFEQTIVRCLRKPFNQLFLQETPIETLVERHASHPGVPPAGFIFHSSRCGSTLMSQMAAALPSTIVISEAAPVDHILGAPASDEDRIEWLRALMSALGQPRAGDERRVVVKFDAWHLVHLQLVQRAFPKVPCVFLYREPASVVASQLQMAGSYMVPGMLEPFFAGLDLAAASRIDREEYISRVLGTIYEAASLHATSGRVTLMNYSQLPDRAASELLEWCRPADPDEARERFRHVAQFDAKTPSLPYEASADPVPTQRAIDMAARFVEPHYACLEAMRTAPAQSD
jgi:gluconate kinase